MTQGQLISKSSDAYQRLKVYITEGRFTAGERLTESKAARLLGIGRGPVRESLLRLEAEGLLEHRGKRRSRVILYAEDENPDELLQRYEMREQIESGARLAAKNMNGWQIDRLRELALKIDECKRNGDDEGRYDAKLAFHVYLMENCGNPLLYKAWQEYRLRPSRPRAVAFEQRVNSNIPPELRNRAGINDIVEAIAAHDQDLAEQLVKSQVRLITDAIRLTSFEY